MDNCQEAKWNTKKPTKSRKQKTTQISTLSIGAPIPSFQKTFTCLGNTEDVCLKTTLPLFSKLFKTGSISSSMPMLPLCYNFQLPTCSKLTFFYKVWRRLGNKDSSLMHDISFSYKFWFSNGLVDRIQHLSRTMYCFLNFARFDAWKSPEIANLDHFKVQTIHFAIEFYAQ